VYTTGAQQKNAEERQKWLERYVVGLETMRDISRLLAVNMAL